jgi:hypothetical protein
MPQVTGGQMTNIADPAVRIEMMRSTVSLLEQRPELGFVLMSVVAAFIDGLAKGPPGHTREAYLAYLKQNFPTLCAELGAETFYAHFRSCGIHEFAPRPPFGVAHGGAGEYVSNREEGGMQWSFLNVDRLVVDFKAHLDSLKGQLPG